MDKVKNFMISVDGMPYAGKTTLCKMLRKLSQKHLVIDDGLLKSATAARCACNAEPDLSSCKDVLVVYLMAAKEDWCARWEGEADEAMYTHLAAELNKTAQMLDDAGVQVLVYNTSKYTPYMIARDVLKCADAEAAAAESSAEAAGSSASAAE